MEKLAVGTRAGALLIGKGLLPPRTVRYRLIVDVEKPITLVTESLLTGEQYREFLAACSADIDEREVSLSRVTLPGSEALYVFPKLDAS